MQKPDLSGIPENVRKYINYLEGELYRLNKLSEFSANLETSEQQEDSELPTSINIVSLSLLGRIKRTPRHFYNRQNRGGMGVFDIELTSNDQPISLSSVDQSQKLLLLTNYARAFHYSMDKLQVSNIRSRGEDISDKFELKQNERFITAISNPGHGYLALISKNGYVRRLRNHIFGDYMKPGISLFDLKETDELIACCITPSDSDLLIVTRSGLGIRFAENLVPAQGCLGIRLKKEDIPTAICAVKEHSIVFIVAADGHGTIRKMSGFSANKSPGGGGKMIMKSDHLAGATTLSESDDLFIISKQSKIIRFSAVSVPAKESVVHGVVCMNLRADECIALASSSN